MPTAALSPSRAGDFVSCPLLFRYRTIDRLPETSSPDAVRGTLVHQVLEEVFDLPAADRTPERAHALLEPAWAALRDRSWQAREVAERLDELPWLASAHEAVDGWYALEDPTRLEPAEREAYVEAQLDSGLVLRGIVDRLDRAPDGALRVVDYKGLAVDTPLPTPGGWTTMGEVRVGDHLLGRDGRPTTVTVKSGVHHRPCYRVTFRDGASVVCDHVHLWSVASAGGRRTLDTDALASLVAHAGPGEVWVEAGAALPGTERELPDPHRVGVRIGGRRDARVPPAYLRAGLTQRTALLAGLAEAVGRSRGHGDGSTWLRLPSPGLRDDVAELLLTLGMVPVADDDLGLGYATDGASGSPRVITAVEPVDSVPTQCVAVDAADSLYLCGRGFVPTHNTGRSPSEGYEARVLFQLKIYALILWRSRGVVPKRLQLVYLGDRQIVTYDPDEHDLLATERKVEAIWAAISEATRTGVFEPSRGKQCDWCPHHALCPVFGGTIPPLPAPPSRWARLRKAARRRWRRIRRRRRRS